MRVLWKYVCVVVVFLSLFLFLQIPLVLFTNILIMNFRHTLSLFLSSSMQPPPPREPVTYMSIPGLGEKKLSNQSSSSTTSAKSSEDKSDIPLAKPGAPHGRYAAFAAETRTTTDVTATQSDMNKRAGRRVFADYP